VNDKQRSNMQPADVTHAAEPVIVQALQEQLAKAKNKPALADLVLRQSRAVSERFAVAYRSLLALSRQRRRKLLRTMGMSLAGAALALALLGASTAHADSITVGGSCTLADAINAANSDSPVGGCTAGSGTDVIVLAGGTYTLTAADPENSANGLPVIASDITIEGNGATIARDAAAPAFRILEVSPVGRLTLNHTTISGGNTGDDGGGIVVNQDSRARVGGELTLNNSTISGNHAARGGGIWAAYFATVTVNGSSVSGNGAASGGGGLSCEGSLTLNNSTVNGNSASWCGGLVADPMAVNNSTVSGNSATSGSGGGLCVAIGATVRDSTVTGNTAASASGGIQLGPGSVLTLERSLVSGNSAPYGTEIYNYSGYYGSGTINGDFNLIGHDGNAGTTNFTPSGSNIVPSQPLAAILAPLADNGGGTLTHALVTGSPALDASPAGPAVDQRGISRPQGSGFDIGAFELEQGSNQAPTVAADNASVTVDEGQTAANSGTVSDADNDPVTLSASAGTVVNNGDGTWSWSQAATDGPASATVTITADDGNGGTAQATFDVTVNNVAPGVNAISAPVDPQQKGATINASATFSDPGTADTHSATWDWGDGNTSAGTVSGHDVAGSHAYATPGVYTVSLSVTDDDGGVGQAVYQFVVVYDPDGGFVTGGGWITSPAGAYVANPDLAGKANFGFNSKYQKGANIPTGNTEFQFKVASLNFKSTSYQWLVVAGAHAKYKGVGTINGSGNYGFMLTATDGQVSGGGGVDTFRIKIWDRDNGDAVVYDNQMGAGDDSDAGTALGGGSIVIHK